MSKSNRKLSAISFILVAVLVFTALFNVVYVGGFKSVAAPNIPAASANNQNTFVKSDLNVDSLREQYLNQEVAQKNIASYDGDRWIIVELEGDTLYDKFAKSTRYNDFSAYAASNEGQKAQDNIKAEHTQFLKNVERHGIDYQIKYTYTAITNALAIKVNADGYNAIRKMSGVVDAYYVEYYNVPEVLASSNAITNNANVYTTGIYDTKGIDEAGEGMVVAVLDTGLDHTHEAFQNMPNEETVKFDKDYISEIVNNGSSNEHLVATGYNKLTAVGTADDFYYNAKVPFAYDYADDDPNVYPAYSNHGTHVAGIVAGKSDYVVNEATGETFVGVAPQAQLVICKVFTDDFDSEALGGANTMGILAALNDCTVLGVDVINMSLGTSAGFSEERGDDQQTQILNRVYKNIEALGISLVVAASNDYSSGFGGGNGTNLASNPDSGTVGAPSTYSSALSVASINGRKSSYITAKADRNANENTESNPVAFITNSSNEFGQEYDFVELLYDIASKVRGYEVPKGTALKFKFVPIKGFGQSTDYSTVAGQFVRTDNVDEYGKEDVAENEKSYAILRNMGYDGVIAFVQRGSTTFNEKVLAAMNAGAQACVIYNNVAGTIRMSLGDIENPIPTCSITMDAGKAFIDAQKAGESSQYGTLYINSEYLAGPFMSEFSSWGPTPSLELKPEITAHGGEIISAVPSGYDKLSGTSMASPNMAGAIALLRQNIQKRYGLSGEELNNRVNQVLMSTATIALNDEGNPYSPRKQGAGLAGIADAINSEGYITVPGNESRTKIELGDDPSKKGEYILEFVMHNITSSIQTYNPITYVMTESMSTDGKTVAEKAYMLNDKCDIKYYLDGSQTPHSGVISVPANSTLTVKIVVNLNSEARQYLNSNFKNGMYVEGFVSMQKTGDTKVTLGLPYLAFYGDWTDAPLFDYDIYEIAQNEQDEEDELRRIKASAAATSILGRYYDDKYILQLGAYIYDQDDDDVEIYPSRDKISLSMFDDRAGRTIYELYMVYAGLLRGASEMDVEITDDATGEVIYTDKLYNVHKSYAAGGSNVGARIAIELKPDEWGLKNNSTYSVAVKGKLDYKGGENPERNMFEFPFTVDYEAPELLGYNIRYESYTENRVTKYRIYMDVEVRDNQYVSAVLPCYRQQRPTGNYNENGTPIMETYSTLLTEYPIAVNGQKGESSTVSFEITDIYEEYVKTGQLYLQVEDYALNGNAYQVIIGQDEGVDAMGDPEKIEFVSDSALKPVVDTNGNQIGNQYTLTMTRNSLYTLNAITKPVGASLESLVWDITTSGDPNSVVRAKGNEIWACNSTTTRATLTLKNVSGDKIYATITLIIHGKDVGREPVLESIQLNSVLNGAGHITPLNQGATPELDINPEQSLRLTFNWTPWYCDEPEVEWTSDHPNVVSVEQDGTITAHTQKGYSYIKVAYKDKSTVSRSVKVVVGRQYRIINYTLYDWYGSGDVVIPSDLNIMYIDEDCFKGRTDIESVVLPKSLMELEENAFMGCRNLKYVEIPGQCGTIKRNAFAGCTALEEVKLGLFVNSDKEEIGDEYAGTITLGPHAFQNCVNLKTIDNETRITAIYEEAFAGCASLERIDLTNLRLCERGAFRDCTSLTTVITNKHTALARDMFLECTALESFDFYGSAVPASMFSGCEKLANITFHNELTSIGLNAFGEYSELMGYIDGDINQPVYELHHATKLRNITLPDGDIVIDADAFKNCTSLETITLSQKTRLVFERNTPFAGCDNFSEYIATNSSYYTAIDGILYDDDVKTLIATPYGVTEISLPSSLIAIADGALACVKVVAVQMLAGLGNIQSFGKYAFADNLNLTSIILPDGLTEIPEGMFDGCLNLQSVSALDNFAQLTTIGKYAFRDCESLLSFSAPNVTQIGEGAFQASGITALPNNNLTHIGDLAFAYTSITTAYLEDAVSIGELAFAHNSDLVTAVLGAIDKGNMGAGAFEFCPALMDVVFEDGTIEIPAFAFAVEDPSGETLNVTLPSSVKTVDAYAFFNRGGIVINLENVEKIGMFAFGYNDSESEDFVGGIQTADLSNVKEIGYAAFAYARLTRVDLPKAEIIADNAFFYNNRLANVTFGALKRIGADVFTESQITEITLPSTFNSRTYDYKWTTYDEKGNPELDKSRKVQSYTAGAFAGIATLEAIHVDGDNKVFFDKDGVLYSKTYTRLIGEDGNYVKENNEYVYVENGYVLEQYPAAKTNDDKEYSVIDGTTIIGDRAFEGVNSLDKVSLPYTVHTIGSYAFFGASVTEYVFDSVEAPTLLAEAITEEKLDMLWDNFFVALSLGYEDLALENLYLYISFDRETFGETNFYANFTNYVSLVQFPSYLSKPLQIFQGISPITFVEQDFGLTMTIPRNGRGYDGVWERFFSTIKKTENNMPDNTSHKAMEAIDAMKAFKTLDEIQSLPIDQVRSNSELGKLAAAARVAYNNIVLSDQLALMTEYRDTLLSYESALRNRKAALGEQVLIKELKVSSRPNKIRYNVGERFDATGMVITAIYMDGSEVALSGGNYTITPEIIAADTLYVTIGYRDETTGQTISTNIEINVNGATGGNPGGDDEPGIDTPAENNKLSGGAIAGIVIGVLFGVALIACAVIFALFVTKNKDTWKEKLLGIFGKKTKDSNADGSESAFSIDSALSAEEKPEAVNEEAVETVSEQKAEDAQAETAAPESVTDSAENSADALDAITTDSAEVNAEESVTESAVESAENGAEESTDETSNESSDENVEPANDNNDQATDEE